MPHKGKDNVVEDRIRLLHLRDAALDASAYLRARARADLDTDSMLLRAVVHCLQVVGEAAARVTNETRDRMPVPPGRLLRGVVLANVAEAAL